ncbi:hypothetical protein K493DRAFT_306961 [Basidiobolus meristosporus CBS 931.73]|uniref:Uncharacterized protein n=1 Tax=Basidiobolus meristosporus CBS 931.73 TaxID=1314790 RepID=A0A1Y1XMV3_9FUNG|nr:hypothetical protein K493DRAFT_306961 [Basidiobolus meristosporus CBS 931.73]|eukprot:ORX87090.1 hypothetical protein K493DRAFT_306961 [Basidiobolus meristosporus CBS 931.73]
MSAQPKPNTTAPVPTLTAQKPGTKPTNSFKAPTSIANAGACPCCSLQCAFCGNKNSKILHTPQCSHFSTKTASSININPNNQVCFTTMAEAMKAGYRQCGTGDSKGKAFTGQPAFGNKPATGTKPTSNTKGSSVKPLTGSAPGSSVKPLTGTAPASASKPASK